MSTTDHTSAEAPSTSAGAIRLRCCRRNWRAPGRCSIPEIVGRAVRASFVKLNPVTLLKNPVMFVVEVGAALTTLFLIRDIFTGRGEHRLPAADRALALVHGAVRELRGGHGGGARQGAGRHPPEDRRPTRSRSA